MYHSSNKFAVQGLFALGWVLAAVPPSAMAGTGNLGTIDVTAERQPSPTAASAVPVTVIDRKSIEASHAQNVAELLQGQADIIVRDSSGIGIKPMVDLGGFGETGAYNSVVLIDGRRVNSPDLSGVDWNQIPLDQIERIEILHGGGASLYGSGTVGGVINIITRIPEAGGNLSASVGSFGGRSAQASLGMDTGRTRVEANASGFQTLGYRDNGEYNRFDGGIRAESDLPSGLNLRLSGNYHHDRMGLPGALSAAQMAANRVQTRYPGDYARTNDGYVDAGIGWHHGRFGLDVDGGFRRRQSHAMYSGYRIDSVINTQSLRPKLSYVADWGAVHARWLAGADLQTSTGDLSSFAFRQNREGIYGHLDIGDEGGRWNFSGGIRSAQLQTSFTHMVVTSSATEQKPAWDVGISYALTDHLRARLNMEQSVRFPLLDERYNYTTNTVNVSVKPQTGRQMGASLRYTLGAAWVEASFRRADLTNELYYDPAAFVDENYVGGTRHDVWMVVGHWRASGLMQLSASYTYTAARFRSGIYAGHWIPAVPQHRADLGWSADWTRVLRTALNLRYIGKSYLISDQANAHTKLPGYAVADAVVDYRWQHVQMFARVNNLTNRKYSTYGVASSFGSDGYYPAAGISASAGAHYRF